MTRPPAVRAEVVCWPRDGERRTRLAARGTPRLLVLDDDTPPPALDDDEDWIRASAGERDTWARLQALALRATRDRSQPTLVGRTLHHLGGQVTLSPADARLVQLLLDRHGAVVPWRDVTSTLWPDGHGTPRRATTRISRLRTSLASADLTIHTIRGHGILLDQAS